MKIFMFLLFMMSVNLFALSAPSSFTSIKVTDTNISFTWSDNSNDEDGYVVCVKTKSGDYEDCSEELAINSESFIKDDAAAYSSKRYVVIAYNTKDGITYFEESNSIVVKTTHTWSGELLKCVNSALGYGENNTTHIPTKSELESYTRTFYCESKDIEDMSPVVDLKNIYELHLSKNRLSGNIPEDLWQLRSLEILNLSSNQLTGEISKNIEQLTSLIYLDLGYNNLTGEIPAEIGELKDLKLIHLRFNQLSGDIPTQLWELKKLEIINLRRNSLTGNIPKKIEHLTDLKVLSLMNNKLSGNIPTEITQLTKLTFLALSSNQFTGNIPTNIGNLENLNYLTLSHNHLHGTIPVSLLNLTEISSNGFLAYSNCNLYSEDDDVKSFIDNHSTDYGGYQSILDSNSHNCLTSIPTIMYLLN